jgi:hypothetical protein
VRFSSSDGLDSATIGHGHVLCPPLVPSRATTHSTANSMAAWPSAPQPLRNSLLHVCLYTFHTIKLLHSSWTLPRLPPTICIARAIAAAVRAVYCTASLGTSLPLSDSHVNAIHYGLSICVAKAQQ